MSLLQINDEQFVKLQRQRERISLKEIFEAINKEAEEGEFVAENDVLYRIEEDHVGNVRKQVAVPEDLRDKVKALCHESTSAHLGITKFKDKLARYFFWKGCFEEM